MTPASLQILRSLDFCSPKLPVTVISMTHKGWLGRFLLGDLVNDTHWPVFSQAAPHGWQEPHWYCGNSWCPWRGRPWNRRHSRPETSQHLFPAFLPKLRGESCVSVALGGRRQEDGLTHALQAEEEASGQRGLARTPVLLLTSFGILGKLLTLFVPQCPQYINGCDISTRHKLSSETENLLSHERPCLYPPGNQTCL